MGERRPPVFDVELEGVHKSFGAIEVLRGIDLRIERGTTCVILGVSGSGKSVLLKSVAGLVHPDRGRVRLYGVDLATAGELELVRIRRHIGLLFQAGALFDSMTAFDNVAFPLRELTDLSDAEVSARVEATLSAVGLSGVEELLPADLSGGMRKRLAFARALVTEPSLLLMDEPTSGLDPITSEYVTEALAVAKERGITSLLITPDLPCAFRLADALAFLHEGRILEQGSPEQLRASKHPEVQAFLRRYLERERLREQAGPAAVLEAQREPPPAHAPR